VDVLWIDHQLGDFTWDTVVAAATMPLALGTFWLARAARADLNAQTRPVLLVAAPPDKAHPFQDRENGGWEFSLPIRNHGRGPARLSHGSTPATSRTTSTAARPPRGGNHDLRIL
jgi:hypothetical protein